MQIVTQNILKDTMYYNKIPVFIYKIYYPSFTTSCSKTAAQLVNEYYIQTAKRTEQYCRTVLYPQAVDSARYIQTNDPPFNSYTLDVNYKITYNSGCIVSLYLDTYTYMGGAHGETKRTSDTWSFKTGTQFQLHDFYPLTPDSLLKLQKSIELQIAERLKKNPGAYFDNYPSLLKGSFHAESYYLLPGSGVIYYQQYDIAPYSTGLPEFYFPLKN